MKILLIDDENDIRRIARLALSKVRKMDVVDVSNGQDGIEKAESENPDVILLDVMMPSMDGPSTLAALKSNPNTCNIPVIFLTAKAMPSELERLRSLGAIEVLTKPFDPLTLAAQIRKIISS